jgi:HSP20 family molecular chaperone IbpA
MEKEKIKISPELCVYADKDHTKLTIEAAIPGVKKEDITVKMHEDSFSMSAPRDEMEYVTSLAFCCPVKAEAARAKYENDVLKIVVPFKDLMEDAIRVKIEE